MWLMMLIAHVYCLMLNMLNPICLIPQSVPLCVSPYVASAYLIGLLWYAFRCFTMLLYTFIRFDTISYPLTPFHTLSNTFICFHTLLYASIRFHMLSYAFIPFHTLSYASIRFHNYRGNYDPKKGPHDFSSNSSHISFA